MSERGSATKSALITRARALGADDANFSNFLFLTVSSVEDEDLERVDAAAFEQQLRHSFARFGQRETGEHLIHIWRPEGGRDQIVDIYIDDMPFLVDSVLAAIRAHGATVQLVAHPILPVDMSRRPHSILRESTPSTRGESFLQIRFDPITDEEALDRLFTEIGAVLTDVRRTVQGWRPMLERLRQLVHHYRQYPPNIPAATMAEALHYLAWLADHNFTFLGMREYSLSGQGDNARLEVVAHSGLGILQDPNFLFLRSGPDYVEMTPQHVAFLKEPDPIMITKANVRARVHRRGHMDYVGIKLYGQSGELTGELRVLGLFTSGSFATPHADVPVLRRKISDVMKRSGHDPRSHDGKALMAALETFPREELYQISEQQLYDFATAISTLAERPRVRVLPRIDRFDNFVSILVYLPRERYSSDVRAEIGKHFAKRFDGRVSAYYPHFPEGELVRVHFIIGRNGGETPRPDNDALEEEVSALTRTFGDRLMDAAEDPGAILDYWDAFGEGYQSQNSHLDALQDIPVLKSIAGSHRLAVRLMAGTNGDLRLKLYHPRTPLMLSNRVPMLENFGFRVIDETTHTITPRGGGEIYLHDMSLSLPKGGAPDPDQAQDAIEKALVAVWSGDAESDGYNRLVLAAGLSWDLAALLRSFGHYLRQIGVTYSQRYMWEALSAHPDISSKLVALFVVRHDPAEASERKTRQETLAAEIRGALNAIKSIDEDRILRHFLNLVESSVRTNFFQRDPEGTRRPALATKYDSTKVEGMPAPVMFREIHVYAPRVEGIHMRGGPVARGGLRWSDRPEDFRTEILGLVKAQMVKNAVIVPTGSKGGFVPKQMPDGADREQVRAEGIACYKIFIGALLDLTDNLDGDKVVPPHGIVRHDGDDPYLVVAADKGTASFSDIANAISQSRNFWLGDAFASGGSAGYDHKKMGITARGAFEAVKRHFREMNRDTMASPFTVVGVGDMSGDVFGNGMLLSRHTRLVAAFDHRDIFIDPAPDPETSFIERKRLFEMGNSSWQDYDSALLSEGGGIYSRAEKSIALSPQARDVLGIAGDSVTPTQLMQAILRADADLMWFGGIGTYVRAGGESDLEVGDRANDAIRIEAGALRVSVIGEGANLGMTQKARVEFALAGGRLNTDAIDNSAGVNSSDLEVNIKIALASQLRAGTMTDQVRNAFLSEMTAEVAELCTRNNYLQTLALSLAQMQSFSNLPDHAGFMQTLESAGKLDRAVEFLPSETVLGERAAAGSGLTRPELSVVLAYAKNDLFARLVESRVPDDPYLGRELFRYFPDRLREKHPETIETHRLRREVIATVLSNAMINRGGPAYVYKMVQATSADAGQVALGYAAARDAFGLQELNAQIDAVDAQMDGPTQLKLYAEVQKVLMEQTLWFLRNVDLSTGLSAIITRYRDGVGQVRANLSANLPNYVADSIARHAENFKTAGAPAELSRKVAELSALTLATDIVFVAEQTEMSVADSSEAYFRVLESFKLGRITEQGSRISLTDRYDRMALDRALANVMRAQRDLTANVLSTQTGTIPDRYQAWHASRAAEIDRIGATVSELVEGELSVSRLSVAAGLLSDLVRA